MRRRELQTSAQVARQVFERVGVAHLVVEGPHVRPVHPIVVEGRVCFHGAAKGEKSEWAGQQAVISVHEIVAQIPSYFRHPERACPATTYYRSAEVRGPLVELMGEAKSAALMGLMRRFQPQGGYRTIDAADPMYTAGLKGVRAWCVDAEPVGRIKLGQGLSDSARHLVQEGLWSRGAPGDDAAIEAIQEVSGGPEPEFLVGPGVRLVARVPDARVAEAVALVKHEYWNERWDEQSIARAHLGAAVWVGAVRGGALVATARAVSDGGKMTYVGDVAVRSDCRGSGVGSALLRLLGSHALVRRTRWTALHTRGAESFYENLGYTRFEGAPDRTELRIYREPWPRGSTVMDAAPAPSSSSACSDPR